MFEMSDLTLTDRQLANFWRNADKRGDDDCWPWLGYKDVYGYGKTHAGGRVRFATHISLHLAGQTRPAAPANHALHGDGCGRDCVNPNHLRWGSNTENIQDRMRLGRPTVPPGEGHPSAKLTEEAVRNIRASSASYSVQAKAYGVTKGLIGLVKRRVAWRHVV